MHCSAVAIYYHPQEIRPKIPRYFKEQCYLRANMCKESLENGIS